MTIKSAYLSESNLGSLEALDMTYKPVISISDEIVFPINFMIDPSCSSNLSTLNLTSTVFVMKETVCVECI